MGYSTEFYGSMKIEPPLSQEEVKFLQGFSRTRRCKRKEGPYYVAPEKHEDWNVTVGQDYDSPNMIDHNDPPEGQPEVWCKWTVSDDGTELKWDGGEKFYNSSAWLKYLSDHFLGSKPKAAASLRFVKPHRLTGEIMAQGDDPRDRWKLTARDGKIVRHDLRGVSGRWVKVGEFIQ